MENKISYKDVLEVTEEPAIAIDPNGVMSLPVVCKIGTKAEAIHYISRTR